MGTITQAELLERNKFFQDRHKGERCFVIGNGPSLKLQDISPLAHELTFVMNSFYKHPVIEEWHPTYHFLADPAYFDGTEPFFKLGTSMTVAQFFEELRSRLRSSSFFVPLWGAKAVLENAFLPLERTYFVPFRGLLRNGLSDVPDFTKAVPGVQSVSQIAIMAAMYMGCSPIYLMGLDHNWLASWGKDPHFYGTRTIEPDKIPSFRIGLEANLSLWYGYEHLLKVSKERGIQILNATQGGLLDVFERVSYASVVTESVHEESHTPEMLSITTPDNTRDGLGHTLNPANFISETVQDEKQVLMKPTDVEKDNSPVKAESPYPPNIPTEQILQQRAIRFANQANPLVSQGNYADAVRLLDEAMYNYARLENLQYLRAACLWKLGRLDEAKIAAISEVRTFPKNQLPRGMFSQILPEWEYVSDGWRIKNSTSA